MIIVGSRKFSKFSFENEDELEKVVASHYEAIFGENSLCLPQKSIATSSGVGSVPDFLIIDLAMKSWYIVEIELAKHGTWQHIVPQLSREIAAAVNPTTKRALIIAVLNEVEKSEELKKTFADLGISQIKVQGLLEEIMERPPIIAIPIDEIPVDLKEWAEGLGRDVRILKIEKYWDKEGHEVAYEIPELISIPSPLEDKEQEERTRKPITEDEFLAKCEEPGRILFKKLKDLATEKKHELVPRTQAFSYYVVTKTRKFCPLTIWSNSAVILKWNLTPEKGVMPDANIAFWDVVGKIGQLSDRFERLQEPYFSTRLGDLTEDDINRFVSAFRIMLDSIQ